MSNQTNNSTNIIPTEARTTLVGASEVISMDGDVRLLINSLRITKLHILFDNPSPVAEYILAPNSHPLIAIDSLKTQDEPKIVDLNIPLIVQHPHISGIDGFVKLHLALSIEPEQGTIRLTHTKTVLEFLQFRQKSSIKSSLFKGTLTTYSAYDHDDDIAIAGIDNPYLTPKTLYDYYTHAINVVGYEIETERTTCHDRNRVETHTQ